MCQIIVSSNFNLSDDLIASIYARNKDGFGYMIHDNGATVVEKCLPKNAKSAIKFYKERVHGKKGAVHFRMRTDGDCTLDRVHPYEVVPGKLWVMHNGVLSGYRSKDEESDTQKYIRAVLRPLLRHSLKLLQEETFLDMLGADIHTGNRLVFMDYRGKTAIVNDHTGYWFGEDWYANSYSFDARRFYPEHFKPIAPPPVMHPYRQANLPGYGMPWKPPVLTPSQAMRSGPVYPDKAGPGSAKLDPIYPDKAGAAVTAKAERVAVSIEPALFFQRLDLDEAMGHICKDPQEAAALAKAMRSLRALDAQEYYGILTEITTAVNRCTPQSYDGVMVDLLSEVKDALESYELLM